MAKYKIHPLTISDALNLMGILSGGGLAGQAAEAISQLENLQGRGPQDMGPAIDAFARLLMGALANRSTRDELRGFLFTLWKTTEDEQATEDDLDIEGRLTPKYVDGELDKKSPYYRKLRRFYQLPPNALPALAREVYQSPGFADFLGALKEMFPSGDQAPNSPAQQTQSNGSTGLEAVRSDT